MSNKSSSSSSSYGCGSLIMNLLFGAISVNYLIWFWGNTLQASDTIMNMPFVAKFIIGLFFGFVTIPAAIMSWILHFFWMPF